MDRAIHSQPDMCSSGGEVLSANPQQAAHEHAPHKANPAHQCSILRLRHGLLLLDCVAQHRLAVQCGGRRHLPLDCAVRLLLLELRRLLQLLLLLLGEVQTVAALLQVACLQVEARHLRSFC